MRAWQVGELGEPGQVMRLVWGAMQEQGTETVKPANGRRILVL